MYGCEHSLQPKEQDYSGEETEYREREPGFCGDVEWLVLRRRVGGTHDQSKASEMIAVADCSGVCACHSISLAVFSQPTVRAVCEACVYV